MATGNPQSDTSLQSGRSTVQFNLELDHMGDSRFSRSGRVMLLPGR
jgi:hypothetical protein